MLNETIEILLYLPLWNQPQSLQGKVKANALAVELSLMSAVYSYLTLAKLLTSLFFICSFLIGRVDMVMEPTA